MARRTGKRKQKPVNFDLLPKSHGLYDQLEKVREKHHQPLAGAIIAIAWQQRIKPDKDAHLKLGQLRKRTDLDKEFADFDFIVILNYDAWQRMSAKQQTALLDHELCHGAPMIDEKTGEQKKDDRGRLLWRMRKHDIEEFREVVERHGCYKRDLEDFIRAGADKLPPTLFDPPKDDEPANGKASETDRPRRRKQATA
jgi:hypothetical protein